MWARTSILLAVLALAGCGDSTDTGPADTGPADIVIGPIADFAPNTVAFVQGDVSLLKGGSVSSVNIL